MYFLYCLFSYPKNWLFKNHQTDQTWQQPCYVCFDGPLPFLSLGCRFTTRQDRGFGVGMRHQLRKRIRRPPAWSVWQRPSGSIQGRGMKFRTRKRCLANCLAYDGSMDLYGSMKKNLQAAASAMMGAKDGKSLTSTPCRRTILLQWHALLKVLAGSVGA